MVCICTEIQKSQCLFKEFTFAVGMPFYRFQSPTLNSDSDLNSWGIYFSLFTVWVTVLPAKSVSIGKMRATGASFLRTTLFGCNILLLTWLAGAGKKSREKHNPEVSDTLCNFPCCCGTHLFAKGYFESLFLLTQGEDPVHPDRGNTWAGAFIQWCRPCHVTQVGTAAAHARVEHAVAAAEELSGSSVCWWCHPIISPSLLGLAPGRAAAQGSDFIFLMFSSRW